MVVHQILRGATFQARALARNNLFSSGYTNSTAVRLLGVPSAPSLISTQETSDGDISVSWAAPSDTGYGVSTSSLLTMYKIDVSLCVAETCDTVSKRVASTDVGFGARLTLIKADTLTQTAVTYTITVLALNALGWSLPSNASQQDYK